MSRVIDAHVHVWGRELLDAAWLRERAARPIRATFDLDMLAPDLAVAGIDAVVLVAADETADGTRRLLDAAADDPRVAAVVGWIDLTTADAGTVLDKLGSSSSGARLRGVRHPLTDDPATAVASLAPGLEALERRDLVLELLVGPGALPAIGALAAARPGLRIVVDHLGRPESGGWADDLVVLRDLPSVALKVSGSALPDTAFAAAVELARRVVGAERLLAGSDWPVVLLRSDHRAEWTRLRAVAASWSEGERAALFGGTAARVYGIAA